MLVVPDGTPGRGLAAGRSTAHRAGAASKDSR